MGCDFYIHTYIEIEHKNGMSYYELPFSRGYYPEIGSNGYDSDADDDDDDDEYDNIYKMCKNYYLTPMKPVIIFTNHSFANEKLKNKYLPILHDKIQGKYIEKYCVGEDTGTFTNIDEIIQVIKKEIRYEPGEGPGLYRSNNIDSEDSESDHDIE